MQLKVLITDETKLKFVIFQIRRNSKIFSFLLWVFLDLKSNGILGRRQMFFMPSCHSRFFFFSPFFSDAWEFQISFVVPDSEAYVQYLQQQYKLCCTSANMAVLGHWGIYHYCVRYWSGSLLLQEESKLVAAVLWSFLLVIQLTPFDTHVNVVKQKPDYD